MGRSYIRAKKDKRGEWRWKLQSGNNRISANSAGDGFKTKFGLIRSVLTMRRLVSEAKIRWVEPTKKTKPKSRKRKP